VRNFPRGRGELCVVRTFRKWIAPVSRRKTGASASTETVDVDLVADIHPAEAGHPSPAARSDHHDAAEAAPVAMAPLAVMATHATTLAPAASGSLGRNERRGESNIADHFDSLCLPSALAAKQATREISIVAVSQMSQQVGGFRNFNQEYRARRNRSAVEYAGRNSNGIREGWGFVSRARRYPGRRRRRQTEKNAPLRLIRTPAAGN
jgi:hypothetical protein